MLKIFMTQLSGYFKKIAEQEEFNLEDGARLLAQAVFGDGHIYIHGFHEMEAVVLEAIKGQEPMPKAKKLIENGALAKVNETDRILLVTRFSNDKEAIALAQLLKEKGLQIVGLSAVVNESNLSLADYVDVHIDTKLVKPLIPDEDGNRFGFPAIMTALFAYYGLYFTMKEILEEY
jgi:uncharacterized phosphosugar-binding protein